MNKDMGLIMLHATKAKGREVYCDDTQTGKTCTWVKIRRSDDGTFRSVGTPVGHGNHMAAVRRLSAILRTTRAVYNNFSDSTEQSD